MYFQCSGGIQGTSNTSKIMKKREINKERDNCIKRLDKAKKLILQKIVSIQSVRGRMIENSSLVLKIETGSVKAICFKLKNMNKILKRNISL